MMRVSFRTEIAGFEVVVLDTFKWDAQHCASRVSDALALIKGIDATLLARVRSLAPRVFCFPLRAGAAGEYSRELRTCLVDPRYIVSPDTPTFLIANTIIHEAMHARLHDRGIPICPATHQRIESICIRAEIAFLSKIGTTEAQQILVLRRSKRNALRETSAFES